MAKYSLSNKALEDLSKIWEYTYEVWSELQAEKYYYMLLDTCQDSADGNLSGKSYPEKAKGSGIEVARFLHERMDLKNRIQE
jgi:toxin ParE1/3/4